jgi:phage shock protein A
LTNSSDSKAVPQAEAAVHQLDATVRQLAEAMAAQTAAYRRTEDRYLATVRQYREYERKAAESAQQGQPSAALAAAQQALELEGLLPQLKEDVETADRCVTAARQQLERDRHRLKAYRAELDRLRDLEAVNRTLAATLESQEGRGDAARHRFEQAKATLEWQQLQLLARQELAELEVSKFEVAKSPGVEFNSVDRAGTLEGPS